MRQQRDMGAAVEEEVDDWLEHTDQDMEDATRHEDLPLNDSSEVPSQAGNGDRSPLEDANPIENDDRASPPIGETELRFKEEVGSTNDHTKNVHGLVKGLSELHSRMVSTMFDMVRTKQIQELEHTLKSKHEIKVNKLKKDIDELRLQLTTEQGAKHDAVAKVSDCQMQINSLNNQAERHTEELSERLATARRQGEIAGRDKAIEDLRAVNEGERLALQRNYLDQLDKVKKDSYELGLNAARIKPPHQNNNNPKNSDLEALKRTHTEELKSAREAGRQEGRDMAYKELAVGPEDRINNLVQNHNELNTNRKVRELKTIHQNWDDVPQRALPSYILPKGHTPGDKTLYLLAKLSKEVDAARASQLLADEIDRRCQNLPKDPKNRIVTNADIRNVLDQTRTTNTTGKSTGHAASLEPSMTPQPPVQLSSSEIATFINTTQNHAPQKNPLALHISPPQSFAQAHSTPTGNVQGAKKTSDETLQPAKPTPSKPQPQNERGVEDTLKALPPPSRIHLPSGLQTFSSKFIHRYIGGREYTFSKVGPDRKDQVVPWREVIRVNAELHRYAPRLGVHGALTVVQGKPDNGTIGRIYPVILKIDIDKYAYLGHYKVISRNTVPIAAWMDEAEETRIRIAKEVEDTKWGQQLLRDRKIELDGTTLQDCVDQILRCFENDDNKPNLRMEWAVLQLIDFKYEKYKALQTALAKTQEKDLGPDESTKSTGTTGLKNFIKPSVIEPRRSETTEKSNVQHGQRTLFQNLRSATPSLSQKRRHTSGEVPVIKRPKMSASTPRVELNAWEKNLDGSLVEEPNGSTIFVDAGSEESEVKNDEENNGVKVDLYNASPAPRGRGRVRKSAPWG